MEDCFGIKKFGREHLIPYIADYQLGDKYENLITGALFAGGAVIVILNQIKQLWGFEVPFWIVALLLTIKIPIRIYIGYAARRYELDKKLEHYNTDTLTHYGKIQIDWNEENNTTLKNILLELKKNGKQRH